MDIHQSIDEILESDDILGHTFYDVFLKRYPQVQQFFRDVNMQRQAVVLSMALLLVEQYHTYRYPAIAKYLRTLGTRHQQRQIPPQLFACFRDAMLEALAAHHGAAWSAEVERQWREALDVASAVMLQGYITNEACQESSR